MGKIGILMLMFLLAASFSSHASTIGNPETAGQGKVSFEGGSDYVFSRDLESDSWTFNRNVLSKNSGEQDSHAEMTFSRREIDSQTSGYGKLVYGLLPNLDIYAKAGGSEKIIRGDFSGVGSVFIPGFGLTFPTIIYDGHARYETQDGFDFGGGVKFAQPLGGGWTLGCDFQYSRQEANYEVNREFRQDVPVAPLFGLTIFEKWKGNLTTNEWRISPYVSKKMGSFLPYAGASYSYLKIKDRPEIPSVVSIIPSGTDSTTDVSTDTNRMFYKNDDSVGVFAGFEYRLNPQWSLQFEGRFIDEEALSAGARCSF